MRRMLRLHRIFVAQYMKNLMEYKVDFMTGAISFLLGQIVQIAFIGIIFSQIPDLVGWTFHQILFIYGFSLLPKGIDHLLFDNLWSVGYFIVRKGDFDKYLTRPINSLFYVIAEKFCVDAFGELAMGIILICYSLFGLSIEFYWYTIPLFLIAVIFATLIYTSIKIATSAVAFWTKASGHITHMFYMTNDFSKYPTTIYNKFVRGFITYVIPFAFTAFYPASYFLTGEDPLFCIGGTVVAAVVLFTVSVLIWNKGIKAYESAGS